MEKRKITLKEYKYYSSKYLEEFTSTKSLNKLEEFINVEAPENARTNYVSAAYVYYNKLDLLSKIKHPTLFENVELFKERMNNENLKLDPYRKVQVAIEHKARKKEIEIKHKTILKDYILKEISENNFSKNEVAIGSNCDYSAFFKFLNGDVNQMSNEKIESVMNYLDGLNRLVE